jgi:TP901 family phage tail tape measure protein
MGKIRQLRDIIAQHNQDLKYTSRVWGSLASFAGKLEHYQTLLFGVIGAVTGLVTAAKSATKAFAEFDDKLADVMKTTGLSREEALLLSNALGSIDTRTSQNELLELARIAGKLGITGQSDLLGFTRAADQAVVALSQDLGGNVEETVRQLGKLVDIFKLEDELGIEQAMLKVGSALNSLGAASTANEGYMVEFAKRVGGIAPVSGISITKVLGLAATLDQLGQTSEVSATVFNRMIPKMFTDTEKYADLAGMSVEEFTRLLNRDANEAFVRFLEGLRGNGSGFQTIAKDLEGLGLEGARVTGVLAVLAGNTDLLRQQQEYANSEFRRGVSLTQEFNVKNQTAQANLEKAIKKFREMAVALGQMLVPVVQGMVHKGSSLVQILMAAITVINRYKGVIITTAAAYVSYAAAVRLVWLWESRKNKEKGIGLVLDKLGLAMTALWKGAMLSLIAVQALLTGNITRASAAMKLFNTVTRLNPIGLVVSAVTALGVGLWQLQKSLNKVSETQKVLNSVSQVAKSNTIEQRLTLERLIRTAVNETHSLEMRQQAIEELNRLSPEYLGNLTLENIHTRKATEATDAYTESLLENARAIAAQEKLVELEKKHIDEIESGNAAKPSPWQSGWNYLKSAGNMAAFASNNAATSIRNLARAEKQYADQKETLYGIIDGHYGKMKKPSAKPGVTGGRLADGGADYDDTSSGSGKTKKGETVEEKRLHALELWNQKRQLEIKRDYRQRQISQGQYEAALLEQEMQFLYARRNLYEKDSSEYLEVDLQIQDKLIDAREQVQQRLRESAQILEEARIDSLEEGLDRELALEQQRYDRELEMIRSQLIEKERLSRDEEKINANLNAALEKATAAHLLREKELKDADAVQRKMMDAVEMEERAVGITQQHEALRAIARAQYEEDVLDARGNQAKIAKAERALSKELIRIKMEEAQARAEIDQAIMQVAMDGLGVLIDVVGQETALGKALFLMQQAAAIGQVVFQTAIANAKAVAASPLTAGQPWVGINTASAAVSIASIIAQSIAKFVVPKTQYYYGGFTDGAIDEREPAGIVHGGEFVASAAAVRNPTIRPVLDWINRAQQSGAVARLNLGRALGESLLVPRFREGGFTSQVPRETAVASWQSADPELLLLLRRNIEVQERLLAWKPRVATELIKRDLDTLELIQKSRGL